jgi:hypothetical protein
MKALEEAQIEKLETCMKQPLNLRVERIFWTPINHGLVVLYQSENLLRFSRNRLPENQITDYLMLNCKSYYSHVQQLICSSNSTTMTRSPM